MSAPAKTRGAKAEQTKPAPGATRSARGSASHTPASKPGRSLRPPQGNGGYRSKARRAPAGKTPPRYRTDSSRERILRSALQAAGVRGYEALRITDVTDPVGVQRQAFYAHFRDKRHCLAELLSPKLGAIERMAASASEQELDWAAQIMSAIDEVLYERFQSEQGTKGRLISALRELLSEKRSLAAVRIGDLVKAAHVPQADFYKNFAGKRECFACLYEKLLGELVAEFEALSSEPSAGRGGDDLPAALRRLAELLLSDAERLRLLVIEASQLPESPDGPLAGAWQGSLVAALGELIGRCGQIGPERQIHLLAGSVVEVIRSAVSSGDPEELPGRLEGLAGALVGAGRSRVSVGLAA